MKKLQLLRTLMMGCLVLSFFVVGSYDQPFAQPASKDMKVIVEMYGFKLGSIGYVATFTLAELVNAKSNWVQAVAIESVLGSNENAFMIIRNPDKQDRMLGYMPNMTMHAVKNGVAPFKKPFLDMRTICKTTTMGHYFLTTNPNIKTIEDIRGKRVGLHKPGGISEEMARRLLEHGYGITYKDIKVSHMDFDQIADAIIDGTIEVGYAGGAASGSGLVEYVPTPAAERMCTVKKLYAVTYTKAAVDKTRKEWGAPFYSVQAKAKTIGKTTLPQTEIFLLTSGWSVTKRMPDDLVTELVKIIYENVEEFGKHHAALKAMTKETLPGMAIPKEDFHEAAVKFYESKGLKVGVE